MDLTQEEKDKIALKIEDLKNSKWKQQTLPAWRPQPTTKSSIMNFMIFSILFLIIGISVIAKSNEIYQFDIRYDLHCGSTLTCFINFNIPAKVDQTINVYYEMDNFYQNHKTFIGSRSSPQLNGKGGQTIKQLQPLCGPTLYNKDLHKWQQTSVSGKALPPNDVAIPCGLAAKAYFNDTYVMRKCSESGGCPTIKTQGTKVNINENGIAWTSDVTSKFQNTQSPPSGKKWQDVQWIDMQNEHFIVWMRLSGLFNFRKLWGRIESGIEAGNYQLEVTNNFSVVQNQGSKSFVMSTSNNLGGNNTFLGGMFIILGLINLVFTAIFAMVHYKRSQTA